MLPGCIRANATLHLPNTPVPEAQTEQALHQIPVAPPSMQAIYHYAARSFSCSGEAPAVSDKAEVRINPNPLITATRRRRQIPQITLYSAPNAARSRDTPAPIVELTETPLINVPLEPVGLAFATAVKNAMKFSRMASSEKLALPIPA